MANNRVIAMLTAVVFVAIAALLSHVLGIHNVLLELFMTGCAAYIITGALRPALQVASEDGKLIVQVFDLKRSMKRVLIVAVLRSAFLSLFCAALGTLFRIGLDEKISTIMLLIIIFNEYLSMFQAKPSENVRITMTEKSS